MLRIKFTCADNLKVRTDWNSADTIFSLVGDDLGKSHCPFVLYYWNPDYTYFLEVGMVIQQFYESFLFLLKCRHRNICLITQSSGVKNDSKKVCKTAGSCLKISRLLRILMIPRKSSSNLPCLWANFTDSPKWLICEKINGNSNRFMKLAPRTIQPWIGP